MARLNNDPWTVAACRFCGASGRSADAPESRPTSVGGPGRGRAVQGFGDDLDDDSAPHRATNAHRDWRGGLHDSTASVRTWQAFEGLGWTLVEQFERDGRRYVLAIDNRPACPGVERLSQREREIIRRAMLGQSDKAIASDLGLAQSTVRVFLKRAATKVGAKSRKELFERIGRLGDGPSRTEGHAAVRLA